VRGDFALKPPASLKAAKTAGKRVSSLAVTSAIPDTPLIDIRTTNLKLLLIVALLIVPVAHSQTILYEFESPARNPTSQLVQFGDYLYATTPAGGIHDCGAIIKVDPQSGETSVAASFDCGETGREPEGALVASGSFLYGTASSDAIYSYGRVVRFDPATGVLSKFVEFTNGSQGYLPRGALIVKDSFLYGTTYQGGNGKGNVFKVSLDDGTLTTVASFNGSNGEHPREALVEFGGSLYGTTDSGGTGYGTIFKIDPATGSLTSIHQFGSAACFPFGALVASGGFLYGTTSGGATSRGSVFKFDPAGLGISTVATFNLTNGGAPEAGLLPDGEYLYGTTRIGGTGYGSLGRGSVFKIDLATETLTTMSFFNGANGAFPSSSLIAVGSKLYGTTVGGGAGSLGTVFTIDLETNLISTLWSANAVGAPYGPHDDLVEHESKLLGVAAEGGANGVGAIFEVDPISHGLTVRASFGETVGATPRGLLRVGSHYYGTVGGYEGEPGAVFKFDPSTNTVSKFASFPISSATLGGPPRSGLVSDGSFLYGVASNGPTGFGTVYKVSLSTGAIGLLAALNGVAGKYPTDSLMLSGSFLYGAAPSGGSNNCGTVFRVNVATGELTAVRSFETADGCSPNGGLLLGDSFAFGATRGNVSYPPNTNLPYGAIFRLNLESGDSNIVAPFSSQTGDLANGYLIAHGPFLFGTAAYGGPSYFWGTVFRIDPENGEIVRLVAFDHSNGAIPKGRLLATDALLYGTTTRGGSKGGGVVFAVDHNVEPIGKPENVTAAGGAETVPLSWDAVVGATSYEISRDGTSKAYFTTSGTTFQDVTASSNSNYCYKVRARTSRGTSGYGRDFASTVVYADDPLVAGSTLIRAEHVTQLRGAINGIRTAIGLQPWSFTDASLSGQPVKALHLLELRSALNEARMDVGLSQLSFTNPPIDPTGSAIKAVDFLELRPATR
jgi:uncharacterized repeat protein (TIGR03803 family)